MQALALNVDPQQRLAPVIPHGAFPQYVLGVLMCCVAGSGVEEGREGEGGREGELVAGGREEARARGLEEARQNTETYHDQAGLGVAGVCHGVWLGVLSSECIYSLLSVLCVCLRGDWVRRGRSKEVMSIERASLGDRATPPHLIETAHCTHPHHRHTHTPPHTLPTDRDGAFAFPPGCGSKHQEQHQQ